MILLDNLRLVNDRTGIGITQAKILFMWSMVRLPANGCSFSLATWSFHLMQLVQALNFAAAVHHPAHV